MFKLVEYQEKEKKKKSTISLRRVSVSSPLNPPPLPVPSLSCLYLDCRVSHRRRKWLKTVISKVKEKREKKPYHGLKTSQRLTVLSPLSPTAFCILFVVFIH